MRLRYYREYQNVPENLVGLVTVGGFALIIGIIVYLCVALDAHKTEVQKVGAAWVGAGVVAFTVLCFTVISVTWAVLHYRHVRWLATLEDQRAVFERQQASLDKQTDLSLMEEQRKKREAQEQAKGRISPLSKKGTI